MAEEEEPGPADLESPSLELAYEWVKDILLEQAHIADNLDAKAHNFWVGATAIIGIGIPLGLSAADQLSRPQLWTLLVPVSLYVMATMMTLVAIYPRSGLDTMKNPTVIRQHYVGLTPHIYINQMLENIEDAFKRNDRQLGRKTWMIRVQIGLVLLEIAALISWAFYAFWP